MINGFRCCGVLTVFFNLRRSVYLAIKGVSLDEFHHCPTEQEAFELIKSHVGSTSSYLYDESDYTTESRMNWASQSGGPF